MAFNPINTQEELDAIIETRVARERSSILKQYSDYDDIKKSVETLTEENKQLKSASKKTATYETDLANLHTQLDEANRKIKTFERKELRASVAFAKGIPAELIDRLSGDTKEELEADADVLLGIFKANNNSGLPMADLGDPIPKDGTKAAFKQMLAEMKGN